MRLTEREHVAIRDETAFCFGSSAEVFLFGSRVDDHRRGGDIDLMIRLPLPIGDTFRRKIDFLTQLKSVIGDQRIDVVVATPKDDRPIIRIAEEQGVRL